MIDGLGVILNR